MPVLNVLSWNSNGENEEKAGRLELVIDQLRKYKDPKTKLSCEPDVIVIQEANSTKEGAVYKMLSQLGGNYVEPPVRIKEGGSEIGQRAYILATTKSVSRATEFSLYEVKKDEKLLAAIKELHLSSKTRGAVLDELERIRPPAGVDLVLNKCAVRFATWHVPLGVGPLFQRELDQANADAYFFLQNSELYAQLTNPGDGNVGMIAGDLNVKHLNRSTGIPEMPKLLDGWTGVSHHYDHIIGHLQNTGKPLAWDNDAHYDGNVRDHDIIFTTVKW